MLLFWVLMPTFFEKHTVSVFKVEDGTKPQNNIILTAMKPQIFKNSCMFSCLWDWKT